MTVQEYCESTSLSGGIISVWDLYSLYIPDEISQCEVVLPMKEGSNRRLVAASASTYYAIYFYEMNCRIIKLEVLRGA